MADNNTGFPSKYNGAQVEALLDKIAAMDNETRYFDLSDTKFEGDVFGAPQEFLDKLKEIGECALNGILCYYRKEAGWSGKCVSIPLNVTTSNGIIRVSWVEDSSIFRILTLGKTQLDEVALYDSKGRRMCDVNGEMLYVTIKYDTGINPDDRYYYADRFDLEKLRVLNNE